MDCFALAGRVRQTILPKDTEPTALSPRIPAELVGAADNGSYHVLGAPAKIAGEPSSRFVVRKSKSARPTESNSRCPARRRKCCRSLASSSSGPHTLTPHSETIESQSRPADRQGSAWLAGRLWKNPRVRLGSQWHDRIEVLPNMQGLIATFDCVEPSSDLQKQIARTDASKADELWRTTRSSSDDQITPSDTPPMEYQQRSPAADLLYEFRVGAGVDK